MHMEKGSSGRRRHAEGQYRMRCKTRDGLAIGAWYSRCQLSDRNGVPSFDREVAIITNNSSQNTVWTHLKTRRVYRK